MGVESNYYIVKLSQNGHGMSPWVPTDGSPTHGRCVEIIYIYWEVADEMEHKHILEEKKER